MILLHVHVEHRCLDILMSHEFLQHGDWDLDALASLLSEVDYKAAGFTERDMAVLDIDVDGFGFSEKEKVTAADVAIQSVQGSMVAE